MNHDSDYNSLEDAVAANVAQAARDTEAAPDRKAAEDLFPATSNNSPSHGTGADIYPLVMADIEQRAQVGEVKYGERLKAFNGRNAMVDAYQEALDLAVYLRQHLEEVKHLTAERDAARAEVERQKQWLREADQTWYGKLTAADAEVERLTKERDTLQHLLGGGHAKVDLLTAEVERLKGEKHIPAEVNHFVCAMKVCHEMGDLSLHGKCILSDALIEQLNVAYSWMPDDAKRTVRFAIEAMKRRMEAGKT